MGRRLLTTYNVPPRAYFPPGYPLKEATKTFCEQGVSRALQMMGRPDWQSRAGALLASEVCGRGYDLLVTRGKLPNGTPVLIPRKRRGTFLDLDKGTYGDYPIPEEPYPYPGPKQKGEGLFPQFPFLPRIPQQFIPGPRQQPVIPTNQGRTPTTPQSPSSPVPQNPYTPGFQPGSEPPPQRVAVSPPQSYVDYPGQRGIPLFNKQLPGTSNGQPSTPPSSQPPSAYPGPKQPPTPSPGQPPGVPGSQPSGYTPNLPAPPNVKPGDNSPVPKAPSAAGPAGVSLGPENVNVYVAYYNLGADLINFIASFFGQTAIKAQKVGIQDFFTPIFRQYARDTGLPLRDAHFLQFDPEGVQRYTLSNPTYVSLRDQLLGSVGPLARYITPNPGPGITERIVNQFVTNAAINNWSVEQALRLWNGVLNALPNAR